MDESGPVFLHLDDESAVRNLVRRLIQRIGVRLTVVEVGTPQEYVATLERLVVGARPVVAIMTCDPELEDLVDRGESVLGRGFPRTAAPGVFNCGPCRGSSAPWGAIGVERGRRRAAPRGCPFPSPRKRSRGRCTPVSVPWLRRSRPTSSRTPGLRWSSVRPASDRRTSCKRACSRWSASRWSSRSGSPPGAVGSTDLGHSVVANGPPARPPPPHPRCRGRPAPGPSSPSAPAP